MEHESHVTRRGECGWMLILRYHSGSPTIFLYRFATCGSVASDAGDFRAACGCTESVTICRCCCALPLDDPIPCADNADAGALACCSVELLVAEAMPLPLIQDRDTLDSDIRATSSTLPCSFSCHIKQVMFLIVQNYLVTIPLDDSTTHTQSYVVTSRHPPEVPFSLALNAL